MPLVRLVLLASFSAFGFACSAAPTDAGASSQSGQADLDTSGCSGEDLAATDGPVTVDAVRPPTSSCWNVADAGLTVSYRWSQTNDANPEKSDIGFYVALNGGSAYEKATSYRCDAASTDSTGADTSGDQLYTCTATKVLTFASDAKLLDGAYGADGARTSWNVQVAVSLDDAGTWDSLNGANYRFSF